MLIPIYVKIKCSPTDSRGASRRESLASNSRSLMSGARHPSALSSCWGRGKVINLSDKVRWESPILAICQTWRASDTCLCSEMMSFPPFTLPAPELISLSLLSAALVSASLLLRQIGFVNNFKGWSLFCKQLKNVWIIVFYNKFSKAWAPSKPSSFILPFYTALFIST